MQKRLYISIRYIFFNLNECKKFSKNQEIDLNDLID